MLHDLNHKIRITGLAFVFAVKIISCNAQSPPNSFLKKYDSARSQSDKGKCIRSYLASFSELQTDEAKKAANLLSYFKNHDDAIGSDYAGMAIARLLIFTGDYTTNLNQLLNFLHNFEKRHDGYGVMTSLQSIGIAFDRSKNFEQAALYYKKEAAAARELNDQQNYSGALSDTGSAYAQANLPDSGIVYAQQAVSIDYELNSQKNLAFSLATLAENYMARKEYDIALPLLRKSIEYARSENRSWPLTYNTNDLAESFLALHQYDSTIHHARLALGYAKTDNYKDQLFRTYGCLNDAFEKTNNKDSSNKYFHLTMLTKDSLFNVEKEQMVQAMAFKEQLRQAEAETKSQEEKVAGKRNLQYASIAIALISFIILFLLLSRTIIVREKFIRFFGVLGLLAVFEFINLYIHPYLSQITHDSPLLMLLVLMCIGTLLIPLHHRVEIWITKKMVDKNKKIRLEAARKTIAKLERKESN